MKSKKLIQMLWVASAILFGAGGLMLYSAHQFYAFALPATGKVIKINENLLNGSPLYYPLIEFETASGTTCQFSPKRGSSSRQQHTIGQSVELLYLPTHPENARLNTGSDSWVYGAFLFGTGTFSLVLSFFLLFSSKRSKKKA